MESKNITEIIPEYVEEIKEISENITDLSLFYEKSREDLSWFNRLFSPKTMKDMKSDKDIEKFSQYFDKWINDKLQQIKEEYITPIEQELSASKKDYSQIKEPEIEELKELYNILHNLNPNKYTTYYLNKQEQQELKETKESYGNANIINKIRIASIISNYSKNEEVNISEQVNNHPSIMQLMKKIQELSKHINQIENQLEDIRNGKIARLWKDFCISKRLIYQPYKEFQEKVKMFSDEYANEKYFIECYNDFQILLDKEQIVNELIIPCNKHNELILKKRNLQKKLEETKKITETEIKIQLEKEKEELQLKKEEAITKILQQIENIKSKSEIYQMYLKTKNNYETAINNYKEYLKVLNNNYDIMNTISEKTKQVIDYTWQYRKSIKHLEQSSDLSIILKNIADNQFGVQDVIDQMISCSEKLLTITQTSEEILKLS